MNKTKGELMLDLIKEMGVEDLDMPEICRPSGKSLPPTIHICCGTPCLFEYQQDECGKCWGDISCVGEEFVDDDSYRIAACEGHYWMADTYDKSRYQLPKNK